MGRRVRVHITGLRPLSDESRPLLLVANHESFWDGFLLREVQRRLRPAAPFRTVMLASELRRHRWLGLLGAMGIAPGSLASTRALLRRLAALSDARPSSVIAFFPQGRIRPDDPRPLGFRKGIRAVASALAPATLVPVGLRVLPGKTARVEAFLSLGIPVGVTSGEPVSVATAEACVAAELDAIRRFVSEHGEDAADRWPSVHSSLPRAPRRAQPSTRHRSWISRN